MQPLLDSLNTVPGVVGSMVCTQDGRLLAHSFPAVFDPSSLEQAATVLADGATGLETVTGAINLVDLRYAQARMILKPMTGGHLLLLCAATVNVQALVISLSVASKKIEKLMAEPQPVEALAPAVEALEVEVSEPAEAAPSDPTSEPSKSKGKRNWWPSV